jgi:hypothetical protein
MPSFKPITATLTVVTIAAAGAAAGPAAAMPPECLSSGIGHASDCVHEVLGPIGEPGPQTVDEVINFVCETVTGRPCVD